MTTPTLTVELIAELRSWADTCNRDSELSGIDEPLTASADRLETILKAWEAFTGDPFRPESARALRIAITGSPEGGA